MINRLVGYFDLQSAARAGRPKGYKAGGPKLPVFPQYVALVLGIAVQPFLAKFQETGQWQLAGWEQWVPFSILMGIIIFPAVYKGALDPAKPLFVQLCTIFASGIGWQSLVKTVVKLGSHG